MERSPKPFPLIAESGNSDSHFRNCSCDKKAMGLKGDSPFKAFSTCSTNRWAHLRRCCPSPFRAMWLPVSNMVAIGRKRYSPCSILTSSCLTLPAAWKLMFGMGDTGNLLPVPEARGIPSCASHPGNKLPGSPVTRQLAKEAASCRFFRQLAAHQKSGRMPLPHWTRNVPPCVGSQKWILFLRGINRAPPVASKSFVFRNTPEYSDYRPWTGFRPGCS